MGHGSGDINASTANIKASIIGFHDVTNTTDHREINEADTVDVLVETTRDGKASETVVSMTVDQYLKTGSNGNSKESVLAAARREYQGIDYSKGMRARLFK